MVSLQKTVLAQIDKMVRQKWLNVGIWVKDIRELGILFLCKLCNYFTKKLKMKWLFCLEQNTLQPYLATVLLFIKVSLWRKWLAWKGCFISKIWKFIINHYDNWDKICVCMYVCVWLSSLLYSEIKISTLCVMNHKFIEAFRNI